VPGRPALLAFLEVERELRDEVAREEARAARRIEEAEVEASKLKEECERGLKQRVVDAERRRVREVEARARDRVSAARARVQRWIDDAEQKAAEVLPRALDLLTGASEETLASDGDDAGSRS